MKDHKSLCCLCCKSGPISATMSLDRSGFVPGEKLTLNAEVDNKSNKTMSKSVVQLLQNTKFRASDGHTKVVHVTFFQKLMSLISNFLHRKSGRLLPNIPEARSSMETQMSGATLRSQSHRYHLLIFGSASLSR